MEDDLYKNLTYDIIGCAMNVHSELGCGFLESVYQEALEKEFLFNSIPFIREVRLRIKYRNEYLAKEYQADFICYDKIIIELKASGLKLGLLLNFGNESLKYKRLIYTK